MINPLDVEISKIMTILNSLKGISAWQTPWLRRAGVACKGSWRDGVRWSVAHGQAQRLRKTFVPRWSLLRRAMGQRTHSRARKAHLRKWLDLRGRIPRGYEARCVSNRILLNMLLHDTVADTCLHGFESLFQCACSKMLEYATTSPHHEFCRRNQPRL